MSIFITFGLLYFGKVKLNLMSLGGLSLAAGMLVDNAIVVLENINRHLDEKRGVLSGNASDIDKKRVVANAAVTGTSEVGRAVIAATLTTVAVFFPVVYVPGIAGAFFRDQALTVTFSLLVSVSTALLLQPMLSARLLSHRGGPPRGIFRLFNAIVEGAYNIYHKVLVKALPHPKPLLAILLLGLGGAFWWAWNLDRSFMPERSSGDFRVDLELPSGTPLEETIAAIGNLAEWIEADEDVAQVFSQVGETDRTLAGYKEYAGPNTAKIRVILERTRGARAKGFRLQRELADRLDATPGVQFAFAEEGVGLREILASDEATFSMGIVAEDPLEALDVAQQITERLNEARSVSDLRIDRVLGTPNVVVRLDAEEILRSGLDPDQVARELRNRISGVEATTFNEIDQRIDISVRIPRDERRDLSLALSAPIQLASGETVPLRNYISLSEERPVRELTRRNQRRMVTISAEVRMGSVEDAWEAANAVLADLELPPSVRIVEGGERSEMVKSFTDLGWAMLLAVLLVYMILAAQFESFLDPLLIAAVLPIGLAGSAIAIGVTGNSINILSMIGMVALLGIAVNDAIIKVDTMRRLRAEGMGRLRRHPRDKPAALPPDHDDEHDHDSRHDPDGDRYRQRRTAAKAAGIDYNWGALSHDRANPNLHPTHVPASAPYQEAGTMTQFFTKHPVATWMIFAMFMLLGIYAMPRLQIEAIPEIDLPTLTVETIWNGASPQAIQRSITIPVEEAAQRVHDVEEITSTSMGGRSRVEISFRRGTDIDFARVDLNEQLGAVRRNLPLNASQPQILPYVPEEFEDDNFFTVSLESPLDPNQLRDLAESWIVPQVLALEGVADARIMGGANPLIKVFLDRRKLELYDITPDEVFVAINRLDELSGAGVVQQGGMEKFVAVRDPIDIERLRRAVVARRGGQTFTLDMIGTVRSDFEDPVYFVRANGQNLVQLQVEKRSGSNSIAVSRALRKALPKIEENVPFEMSFYVDEDQGADLEEKLRELVYRSFAILALLFILLSISLRQIRLTAIITGSILFAVVISLSLFYFLKISVNFITISGLTVCFGLILDNSILVLDSIHRRFRSLEAADAAGLSRAAKLRVAFEMVVGGSREVLFPILATTLTTIVAFVSFIFLSGRLALYYVPLGISVATALIASLFVAFGWVPMVLNRNWARPLVNKSKDGPNDVQDPKALAEFTEDLPEIDERPPLLERIFSWNARLWYVSVPLLAGLFFFGWKVYDTKVIKGGFWRLPDPQELLFYMRMPAGTDITLTLETLIPFEEALEPIPEGARLRSTTWGNQAFFTVEFDDDLLRSEIPIYYRNVLTDVADKTGSASIYISGFSDTPYFKGSFGGSALNSLVKVTGYNSKRLREICETALNEIERNRRVRNPRITTGSRFGRATQDEVVVLLDRNRLASHGLSVAEVVGHLRRLFGVDTPWTMLIEGEHENIQLSFDDAEELEYSEAVQTTIETSDGESVRIADLVALENRPLSGEITRENQRYASYINWEYVGTEQMRQAYIQKVLGGLDLPYGYDAEESRREFFTQEEEEELTMAVALALIFIFMVLAALFESVTLPILVLISVPMALVGVFMAFWWTDSSFDSSARIGLILLFGIVVNNAILLISRFRTEATLTMKAYFGRDISEERSLFGGKLQQLGGSDMSLLPKDVRAKLFQRSIGRATRIRLRSILLTSGTTIVGLAPLLIHFRETEDKDIWENLALASIGGLASSTILILIGIPAIYYIAVRIDWLWRAVWSRIRRRKPEQIEVVQA